MTNSVLESSLFVHNYKKSKHTDTKRSLQFISELDRIILIDLIRCPFHPVSPQWHVKAPVILPKVQVAGYT